jgi:hypothetical protein
MAFALTGSVATAHDIITTNLTYSRDIARIFARRCVSCHGAGTSVPLTSYEDVRPWAVDIKEQVLNRTMPPWGAVKGFGSFKPDNGLTQEELLIIASWAVGGAPEGNRSELPKTALNQALPGPSLIDERTVSTAVKLDKPLTLYGIEPLAKTVVPSAKIIARLPDGRTQPLVWLFQYDPKEKHAFILLDPLKLPAGTRIEANVPLEFVLQTAAQSALTGMVKTVVLTTP